MKWFLLFLLAQPMLHLDRYSQGDYSGVSIVNNYPFPVFCQVRVQNQVIKEFFINPRSKSDWFDEPSTRWGWNCNTTFNGV